MKRSVIAVAVALLCVSAAVAQQDMVSARLALMKAIAKSVYGNLNRIVKGTAPHDQAVVDAAFSQLEDAAGKIGPLYWPARKT